jgi:hypothetical protein
MRWLGCGVALLAAPISAQTVSPLNSAAAIDTSGLATKVELTAAQQAAAQAKAAADAAALAAAAACQPGAIIPPMETIGGSAGSGDACRLANSVQPRISRVAVGTTVSGGTVSVTWPAMSAVPSVFPIPRIGSTATQVPICAPITGSISVTGVTIKCFTTQSVTVSLLGAVVAPITTAAAGVTVDVLAIPQS